MMTIVQTTRPAGRQDTSARSVDPFDIARAGSKSTARAGCRQAGAVGTRPGPSRRSAHSMRGMSLFIVLVALVMLSLAAVGLIRMVDTGALVAGNLSFKQATTLAADRATEQAIAWLNANLKGGSLHADVPAAGYYASAMLPLDLDDRLKTVTTRSVPDWSANQCADRLEAFAHCLAPVAAESLPALAGTPAGPATALDGIRTRVLILRMCRIAGDPDLAGNSCVRPIATQTSKANYMGASLGTGGYMLGSGASMEYGPYYRIVVRADGPRQTVSYTEATVHFPQGV